MVGQTRALNSIQRLPTVKIIQAVTTIGTTPAVVYTVPTGKKAIILASTWQAVAFGTGTFIQSRYAGVLARKTAVADTNPVQDLAAINLALAAADTIAFTGDAAGNNATANIFITVQESAA